MFWLHVAFKSANLGKTGSEVSQNQNVLKIILKKNRLQYNENAILLSSFLVATVKIRVPWVSCEFITLANLLFL